MTRRPQATLMANPVLVGAATLLVTLVAVFLAYNANSGLPFVPSYQVNALVPDAAQLVRGNEVRIGGKRVGTITAIRAQRSRDGRVWSRLALKLETTVQPLPVDSRVTVRPRSTLGLKYLELQPGRSRRGVIPGGTLPLRNAGGIVELDEVLNAFDREARRDLRSVVGSLGTGLAGRGADINETVAALRPLVRRLRPVAANLAAPATDLRGMLRGVAAGTAALEPVAGPLGRLVDGAAVTLAAVADERGALGRALERAPATERTATVTLREARPVLADAAAVARDLRAGTPLLRPAARRLAAALETGTPVLRRATTLGPDLEATMRVLGRVARDPATPGSLRKLLAVLVSAEPTVRFLMPFQTVCNYLGVWVRNASSTVSEGDENGTWFRFLPVYEPPEVFQSAEPSPRLHVTPYGRFHGECETGNERYAPGQVIGNTPEREPDRTQDTAPPPLGDAP